MAAVVSSTLAASAWMFSATSSFVAAISRIDEDDSSALWASTSTLSAIPFSEAIIWPIDDGGVDDARGDRARRRRRPPRRSCEIRSMTAATPPVTFWTRESVTVRFSPMRLSDSASVPSSSSPSFAARGR